MRSRRWSRAPNRASHGLRYAYAFDTTAFIRLSIEEVQKTLIEAIVLVVIVMFVFLQSWRATLVPAIAVPVVLLGTFAILYVAGFTINTLTLFGLVLSIGLLVDDAIVVVENVERLLEENPDMSPREATIASMDQIQVALVAIALVLSAVFLPMAFFGGSRGDLSAVLDHHRLGHGAFGAGGADPSPRCAPRCSSPSGSRRSPRRAGSTGAFPASPGGSAMSGSGSTTGLRRASRYAGAVTRVVDRKWMFLLIYAAVLALLVLMFVRLPTGFLPTEDQGAAQMQFRLPPGATQGRTLEVQRAIEHYLNTHEPNTVATMFTVAGGGGGGQNTGQGFINLVDWADREGHENSADAIAERASGAFRNFRDAQVFVLIPGAIRGLGQSNGFTVQLQNTSGMPTAQFTAARDQLIAAASTDPALASVRASDLPDVATLKIDMDQERLAALGLTQADVNATLSTAWGGRYVNDFIDRGRVKRVYVQGDAPYRAAPENIYRGSCAARTARWCPSPLSHGSAGPPRRPLSAAFRASPPMRCRGRRHRAPAQARR